MLAPPRKTAVETAGKDRAGGVGQGASQRARVPWPLLLLLGAAVLVLAFGTLAGEVAEGETLAFDRAVLTALHGALDAGASAGPGWLREAGRDVTALGSTVVLSFVSLATVGFLLLAHRPLHAGLVAGAVVGGQALSSTLKLLFHRARPDLPGAPEVFTASFPSGHAMMSAVVYLTLAALLARLSAERRIRIYLASLAVVLVVFIGLSRVYLGVHYPTDVLAGWSVGAAWSILAWQTAKLAERRAAGRQGASRGPPT